MNDEQPHRLVYLVGIPLVTVGLCAFSYWLGLKRGQQIQLGEGNPSAMGVPKEHEAADNLTFFKNLKGKEEPLAQVTVPANKKVAVAKPKMASEMGEKKLVSGYSVQVSAFKDVGKAHELVDDLKNHGFHAYSTSGSTDGNEWYRVFVGPFEGKDKADQMVSSLHGEGYKSGFVTKVDGN